MVRLHNYYHSYQVDSNQMQSCVCALTAAILQLAVRLLSV